MVWWKADTRVKLWLPPSEFQGTGALRPHPDGAVYPREASPAPRDLLYGQPFFLGRLSAGWGWQEAVPGPQSKSQSQSPSHTSLCTWFTISLTQVLISLSNLRALLAGADVGPRTWDKAKIHTTQPEAAACEIKTKQAGQAEQNTTQARVRCAGEMH